MNEQLYGPSHGLVPTLKQEEVHDTRTLLEECFYRQRPALLALWGFTLGEMVYTDERLACQHVSYASPETSFSAHTHPSPASLITTPLWSQYLSPPPDLTASISPPDPVSLWSIKGNFQPPCIRHDQKIGYTSLSERRKRRRRKK